MTDTPVMEPGTAVIAFEGIALAFQIDASDRPLLDGLRWYPKKYQNKLYAVANKGGSTVYMHRVIMGAGAGQVVDHIDHDGLNNTRSNLRFASSAQNAANSRLKVNASGFRGVHSREKGRRFYAQVGHGKNAWRGPTRQDPAEAARDYDREAHARYGDFAVLNFGDAK